MSSIFWLFIRDNLSKQSIILRLNAPSLSSLQTIALRTPRGRKVTMQSEIG